MTDDEWLIRRVHRDQFRVGVDPYVSPKAFRPQVKGYNPDHDGISLFRLACIQSTDDILRMVDDPQKKKAVGLVKVRVSELLAQGLTINQTPVEAVRGHVSIPEMDVKAMTDAKLKPKLYERMDELANIASRADRIIRDPKAELGEA